MNSSPSDNGENEPVPARGTRVELTVSSAGCVSIRCSDLFSAAERSRVRRLVARLFAIPEVAQVAIRPRAAIGEVRFAGGNARLAGALRKLARALLEDDPASPQADASLLHVDPGASPDVCVFRHGHMLTTWRVAHALAGRVRLAHPSIHRHPRRASRVEHALLATHGITDARANPLTGRMLVKFEPDLIDLDGVLELAELALTGTDDGRAPGYDHPQRGMQAVNATLALATAGQFAFPPLLALSAGVLVCTHLDTFDKAWRQARQRQLGAPAVATAVVALTLGTGSFFLAAMSMWMIEFWDRTYHRQLTRAQQRLLAQLARRPPRAVVRRAGKLRELRFADILPGDEVILGAGDVVPGDVEVVAGEGRVEDWVIGGAGSRQTRPGDGIHAGTVVVEGEVTVVMTHCGEHTRAASFIRSIEAATTPPPAALASRGGDLAARAAPATLATAALAMVTGDPVNALAVLRLDYASGPGMTVPIATLQAVAVWLRWGIVVSDSSVVDRIANIDVIVIDIGERSSGDEAALAVLVERLHSRHGLRVGIVGDGDTDVPAGADFAWNQDSIAAGIAGLRARGARIAFAGDGHGDSDIGREVELAISLAAPPASLEGSAHVWVRRDCWSTLDVLWEVVGEQRERARSRLAYTLVPNGVCIAGAFLFGFTSLAALMLTNFGTGCGYFSHLRDLRRLEQELRLLGNVPDASGFAADRIAGGAPRTGSS